MSQYVSPANVYNFSAANIPVANLQAETAAEIAADTIAALAAAGAVASGYTVDTTNAHEGLPFPQPNPSAPTSTAITTGSETAAHTTGGDLHAVTSAGGVVDTANNLIVTTVAGVAPVSNYAGAANWATFVL